MEVGTARTEEVGKLCSNRIDDRDNTKPPPGRPSQHSSFRSGKNTINPHQNHPTNPSSAKYASGYRAPSHTPRASSLFSSLRGSNRSSSYDSPYSSSPYGTSSSGSSYRSSKSFLTDYKPRGGWFASRRSGSDYPPFPSDFPFRHVTGRSRSFPREAGRSRWSFGSR